MPLTIVETNTVVQIDEGDKIVIAEPEVQIVQIEAGQPGVKGDKGDPGEPLEFTVSVPATSWTITHNLNRYPTAWQIYDTANTMYYTGAEYIDLNTIKFTFSAPISGRVLIF